VQLCCAPCACPDLLPPHPYPVTWMLYPGAPREMAADARRRRITHNASAATNKLRSLAIAAGRNQPHALRHMVFCKTR
ncbi:MAG TPA: hypothetical protein PKA47_19270, partial [Accumulibacter sp.]|uniref:hypothetical protein n=1 Tax=Accumulibacter sp. TaxID=2053492 RepID=UPI002B6E0AB6